MCECESWAIKKAEHRIDAFKLWCWRRLFRVPWIARWSHLSILKEISPEYSLEGLMLKLKLQYFGHLLWRTDSFEKTLMLGKIGGEGDDRGWDGWMASPTQWTWVWVDSRSWWWTGRPGMLWSMGSKRVRHDWVTELNWTELNLRGFSSGASDKKYTCQYRRCKRDWFSPLMWKIPGVGNSNPLQYSWLENSMGRGDWWATVCGAAELDTTEQLSTAQHRTTVA